MDSLDNNVLGFDTNYEGVGNNEAYVEGDGTVVEAEPQAPVTPFDVIKKHAEMLGQDINDPKPNCKDCYGRGYIGRDSVTKAPIPCRCIHADFSNAQNQNMANRMIGMSRKERRKLQRQYMKQMKGIR